MRKPVPKLRSPKSGERHVHATCGAKQTPDALRGRRAAGGRLNSATRMGAEVQRISLGGCFTYSKNNRPVDLTTPLPDLATLPATAR